MKLVVTFVDDVWNFEVISGDDEPDYYEEFEVLDLDEAKSVAADIMEELSRPVVEEDE